MTETILVVEDDDNLRDTLADVLEIEGYHLRTAATLQEAHASLGGVSIDMCILDITLPDGEGYSFAKTLREHSPNTMILMLTARSLNRDIEAGFESGADDYVSKPYQLKELLLRVRALLRRKSSALSAAKTTSANIFNLNGFSVNRDSHEVKSPSGESIHLTKKEFDLLCHFIDHRNKAQSRSDLLDAIWGRENYIDHRTVDNFVSKLKKQFLMEKGAEITIRTVRGVGYCLEGSP
ncbi:MAG: DNA-binding response regulator [Alteromonadaceae bacterium]|nr:MAG: DNA-binding response regulator [Alteromonadaceae bacterium]